MKNKIDFNALCPCGSDKVYSDCCWLNELLLEKKRESRAAFEELKRVMREQDFQSLEEANRYADEVTAKYNKEPQATFLGLSPEQLANMMYIPFEATSDVVSINTDLITPDTFEGIPIVKNSIFFLTTLAREEPLKSTTKGNLPRAFAERIFQEIDDSGFKEWIKFRSEEDSLKIMSLRHVLILCGWMKKRKQLFTLTQKGRQILNQGFYGKHFFHLLQTYTRKFNWSFQDGYSEFHMIQRAFLFSLYLLHKKAATFIEDLTLFRDFVRAFPETVLEADARYTSFFEYTARCYSLRFLERFCEYFGFVEIQKKELKESFHHQLFLKSTPFFKKYFIWKLSQ
jgi:hypothetical protein